MDQNAADTDRHDGRRVVIACVLLVIAPLMTGCATDCDEAKDKLDSCSYEIHHTIGTTIHPVPVTINDDCSGQTRCLAECVNAASCQALAFVLNGVSDPNTPIPPGAIEFSHCFNKCAP